MPDTFEVDLRPAADLSLAASVSPPGRLLALAMCINLQITLIVWLLLVHMWLQACISSVVTSWVSFSTPVSVRHRALEVPGILEVGWRPAGAEWSSLASVLLRQS